MNNEVSNYLQNRKELYQFFMKYIESSENLEEDYENCIQIINNQKIGDNKLDLYEFLHLLDQISLNYTRDKTFFSKFEKILTQLKEDIKQHLPNKAIFDIFQNNRRILLFLFKEKIIEIDQYISNKISNILYFKPELDQYLHKDNNDDENSTEFEEKRTKGENDDELGQLIQEDSISKLVSYVVKNSINLKSQIIPSIFETNNFLIDKQPTLIEYAAFCGSTSILKYLNNNGVELTSSLWKYAIHSNNIEIIQILDDNKIKPENDFIDCFYEAIKCHHNNLANWIKSSFLDTGCDIQYASTPNNLQVFNFF